MDFIIDEDGNYIITEEGELIEIEGPEWFGAAEGGMRIVEPITITDFMVGSAAGTVTEGEYSEYAYGTTYDAYDRVIVIDPYGELAELIDTSAQLPGVGWYAVCIAPNGDLYAISNEANKQVYVRPGNSGPFVQLTSAAGVNYTALCAAPNGDIYVCADTTVGTGNIWIRTGGVGAFTSLAASDSAWKAMCAAPNGDIYAAIDGGDIYRRTAGAGAFSSVSAGSKAWDSMCSAPNGDIYAGVGGGAGGGDIWVSTNAGASFAAIADTDRVWTGLASASNGDIYACVTSVGVFKRTAGAGTFANLNVTGRSWRSLSIDTDGIMYSVDVNGYIYLSRQEPTHKIYESLVGSNTGNYPPTDVEATTPKWLGISATNKWKVFDGKVNDQMQAISPAVYTITPGEAFDTVILLNVEADSVTIAVDDPAYSETVVTGATDIVKMDLAGDADSVLTITIANSAGLAKCGEIIIGNYYEIGTMKPLPVVSITDYSVKTQDEWGNWTITQRSYSEKMSCLVNVPYASIDAVIAKLKEYRTTPVVWVGNSLYACTIIYGYWKDWSTPVAARGKSILSLEIEGLT